MSPCTTRNINSHRKIFSDNEIPPPIHPSRLHAHANARAAAAAAAPPGALRVGCDDGAETVGERRGGEPPPPSPDEDVDGVRVESSAREERVHMGGDEVGRDTAGGDAAGEGTAGEDTAGEGTAGGDTAGDTAIEGTAGGHVAAGDKTGADVMSAAAADEVSVPFFGGGEILTHTTHLFSICYTLSVLLYINTYLLFFWTRQNSHSHNPIRFHLSNHLLSCYYINTYINTHVLLFWQSEGGRKEGYGLVSPKPPHGVGCLHEVKNCFDEHV